MKMNLILSCLLCQFSLAFAAANVHVSSLTCNNKSNPLGIDTMPAFSWQLASDDRAQVQTAYQVQVATSNEKLENGTADVFDSDKVLSDQSAFIKLVLPELESSQRYFWRIRVWDKKDSVSAWSDIAWFETGLLNPTDWRAQWISAPVLFDWQAVDSRRKRIPKDAPPELPEPAPLFRKDFSIDKKIVQARAYISGLGYHELYLNGEKVGDHLLDPAFTRYDKRVLYVTHDITDKLSQGDNAVGVMLGNGWYNLTSRGVWGYDYAAWRDDPTLLCQIKILFQDGSETWIISDDSWACAPGPVIFNSIRQGEWYDARREQSGWNTAGFDDSTWHPVRRVRGPQGELTAQSLPPVRIHASLRPKTMTRIDNGHYLVDFGQNMAGFVELIVNGKSGDEIEIVYAEKVKDGCVDQSNIDGLVASTPFQTDRYMCKGGGEERWHARFAYHGFQYVEVSGFPGELTKDNLLAHAISTSFQHQSSFECSNELINQIQEATLWSYRNNFVGYPTDCPQREKNGWTGDAQLAAEAGLFNFDALTSYKKWLQDIADEQQPSGEIAAIIPTAGWGYYWGNGPAWDSAFLLIPYYLYVYTGDLSPILQHYNQMKRYVDFLTREKTQNGIVSWGLGDWCHEKTDTPAEITSTGYYFMDAKLIAFFAELLGKAEDAQKYAALAHEIRDAFKREFVNVKKGTVGNNSQTALSCALYQGIVDSSNADKIVESLIQNVIKNDNKLDFGILGAKYTLNALSDYGHDKLAYQLINHTDYPGWGHWISRGATTLWEDWKGQSSLSHIMFGDVSAWFYKNIAGIQPDPEQPGFQHFYVRPFFSADMSWAKADVKSPFGTIHSEWQRQGDVIELMIRVPVNCRATVQLPTEDFENVTIGAEGRDFVKILESQKASFVLPSGDYVFEIQ